MTAVLVLRHAPTAWNRTGRIQGRTDEPLDAAGRALAATWRVPADWTVAASLASPLARASETAIRMGLAPMPEPRLTEMDWGDWEGRTLADIRAANGAAMAQNESRGLDFRATGGESPREVQARLRPLLAGIGAPTILVTHKGVLRALLSLATGWDMTGPAPVRLRDGCSHAFALADDGAPELREPNIPLGPTAGS